MSPVPTLVRLKPVPEITPVRVPVPAAEPMLLLAARVMLPETVLSPETLRRAPMVPPTPVPEIVMDSAAGMVMPPCRPRVPPLLTVVAPVVPPRALLEAATRVAPLLTVAEPVRVLLPLRTTVPVPLAVIAPEPERSPVKATVPPVEEVSRVSLPRPILPVKELVPEVLVPPRVVVPEVLKLFTLIARSIEVPPAVVPMRRPRLLAAAVPASPIWTVLLELPREPLPPTGAFERTERVPSRTVVVPV
jgi:hypothetical protein